MSDSFCAFFYFYSSAFPLRAGNQRFTILVLQNSIICSETFVLFCKYDAFQVTLDNIIIHLCFSKLIIVIYYNFLWLAAHSCIFKIQPAVPYNYPVTLTVYVTCCNSTEAIGKIVSCIFRDDDFFCLLRNPDYHVSCHIYTVNRF